MPEFRPSGIRIGALLTDAAISGGTIPDSFDAALRYANYCIARVALSTSVNSALSEDVIPTNHF